MGHRNFYFWHLLGCEMFQEDLEALVEHDFFVCFSNPAKRVAKYFSQPKADSKADSSWRPGLCAKKTSKMQM